MPLNNAFFIACKSSSMAVFVLLLYFYTVMVIEKKTKFSTDATKIRHFDLKI